MRCRTHAVWNIKSVANASIFWDDISDGPHYRRAAAQRGTGLGCAASGDPKHARNEEHDQSGHEHDLRRAEGGSGDDAEAEPGRHQSNDKKGDRPVNDVSLLMLRIAVGRNPNASVMFQGVAANRMTRLPPLAEPTAATPGTMAMLNVQSASQLEPRRIDMPREAHTKAAEHHENAAKGHRTAAEHHSKGDHAKG